MIDPIYIGTRLGSEHKIWLAVGDDLTDVTDELVERSIHLFVDPTWYPFRAGEGHTSDIILFNLTGSWPVAQQLREAFVRDFVAYMRHCWIVPVSDIDRWIYIQLRGRVPLWPHPHPAANGRSPGHPLA